MTYDLVDMKISFNLSIILFRYKYRVWYIVVTFSVTHLFYSKSLIVQVQFVLFDVEILLTFSIGKAQVRTL